MTARLVPPSGSLTAVAVKTANYAAAAGEYVPVDTTAGAVTVTLPNAPADGMSVGIKHVIQGGSNAVTVACAGSDVFNKAGGPTTGTLSLLNQGFVLLYKASSHIWYVEADDLPLSQLDLRYLSSGSSSTPGTAFPVAPSDGDLFYRTDRRILYEYDATSTRWLSLDRKYVPFSGTEVLAGGTTAGVYGWLPIFEDVYVETIQIVMRSGTVNDASNFWQVIANALTPALGGGPIVSFTTALDPVSHLTIHTTTLNTVYPASTYAGLDLLVNKTGAPNKIEISAVVVLRSCG